MGNNIPRRHHYVPRLLLRNFTDPSGALWVYDSRQKKCWKGRPESAAFERDLYTRKSSPATPEFSDIENFLSESIDGPGATAIAGLLKRERLAYKQWCAFLRFVAAQLQRTPAAFEHLAAFQAPLMQEMFQRMGNFDPEFRERVTKRLLAKGATQATIEKLFKSIKDGKMKVTPAKDYVVALALASIDNIADELSKMKWTFLGVEPGEPDLIIGDHPVMLADPVSSAPLGLRNPNIELLMPLSRGMVACARRDGPDSYGKLAHGMSELINDRTLRGSRRFVFAVARCEHILADAVRLHGTGPKMQTRRIQVGKGLMIVNQFHSPDLSP